MNITGALELKTLGQTEPGELVQIRQAFAIVVGKPEGDLASIAFLSGNTRIEAGSAIEMNSITRCLSYGKDWNLHLHEDPTASEDPQWSRNLLPYFAYTEHGLCLFLEGDFELLTLQLAPLKWLTTPRHVVPVKNWSIWRSSDELKISGATPVLTGALSQAE